MTAAQRAAWHLISSQPVKQTLDLNISDFTGTSDRLSAAALRRIRHFVRQEAMGVHDTVAICADIPFSTQYPEGRVRSMVARLCLLPLQIIRKRESRKFGYIIDIVGTHNEGGSFRIKVMRSSLVVLLGLSSAFVGSSLLFGASKIRDSENSLAA
ncbi:MAG: hypothetical protein HYY44_00140 [Deltaproteobacteria bacterium]|nr:hypothetical protein [Deltaproteobacteria bacterium]